MSRQALGRGLGALLPTKPGKNGNDGSSENRSGESVINVPVADITPSRFQPRRVFDEEKLQELAASIKEQGVIQPVVLCKRKGKYELIAGERRWRATKLLGYKTVPGIIKTVRDSDALEMAIIENIQRDELSPIEEANAFDRLMNEFAFTQEKLAEKLGKSRSNVANILRLLKLPDSIKDDLGSGRLTMGHARALLSAKTEKEQLKLRDAILKAGMNVRQVEKRVKNRHTNSKISPSSLSADMKSVINRFEKAIESKVQLKLKPKGKGGTLTIGFSDNEDLDRILSLFE